MKDFMVNKIIVFDFDGTITQNDTLISFLRFTHGWKFYIGFFLLLPVLICYKIGLIRNSKAKEFVFSWFFCGWKIEKFNSLCRQFAKSSKIKVRPAAMEMIKTYLGQENVVVIVSASISNWVGAWADINGISCVLSTDIEVVDGVITGKFLTPNCYGAEKVTRLKKHFPELNSNRENISVISCAHQHSNNKELLLFADEGFYKCF